MVAQVAIPVPAAGWEHPPRDLGIVGKHLVGGHPVFRWLKKLVIYSQVGRLKSW